MKKLLGVLLAALVCITAACAPQDGTQPEEKETKAVTTALPKTDNTKWQYDADNGIYYQIGLSYCEKPADEKYEKLAVFVPAKYMKAEKNSDGTYTCEIDETAQINGYSADSAPIIMPIETPGYYAAEAVTEDLLSDYPIFDLVGEYSSQGFVCAFPGCRGIDEGAPAGVTDLKAAVRYLRYCDDVIAGDSDSIFVYGMSGGGAQAAILGASGDSELYDPYLKAIGAVEGVPDAVEGSMDWCPITDLDTADAEYEWMMGCTRSGRTDEENAISEKLALAFADYINGAGFVDEDGYELTLTESKEGIYQSGSYYDHIKSVIEQSLNNYLSDTDFSDPELNNSYGSAENYIKELNSDKKWVKYDSKTNTATITSVADFVKHCKPASNLTVAFDTPLGENDLFGYGDGKGSHFDRILADILTDLHSEYAAGYNFDLAKTDFVGNTVEQRVDMYAPLYFLMPTRDGYGKSKVAKFWRIRTGIKQQNTSLTTEVNLALALQQCDSVESVDFETVWAQGHETAERKGDSTENFIEWVNDCMKG